MHKIPFVTEKEFAFEIILKWRYDDVSRLYYHWQCIVLTKVAGNKQENSKDTACFR